MTRLRFEALDDGRVLITAAGEAASWSVRVPSGEAKRFAWAILNELDPDEARASGAPVILMAEAVANVIQRKCWGPKVLGVLHELRRGEATATALCEAVDDSANNMSCRLPRMMKRDLITRRKDADGTWSYRLTDLGQAVIA